MGKQAPMMKNSTSQLEQFQRKPSQLLWIALPSTNVAAPWQKTTYEWGLKMRIARTTYGGGGIQLNLTLMAINHTSLRCHGYLQSDRGGVTEKFT